MNEELKPLKKSAKSDGESGENSVTKKFVGASWASHWIVQTILVVMAVRLAGLLPTFFGVGVFYLVKKKQSAMIAWLVAVFAVFVAWAISVYLFMSFR